MFIFNVLNKRIYLLLNCVCDSKTNIMTETMIATTKKIIADDGDCIEIFCTLKKLIAQLSDISEKGQFYEEIKLEENGIEIRVTIKS